MQIEGEVGAQQALKALAELLYLLLLVGDDGQQLVEECFTIKQAPCISGNWQQQSVAKVLQVGEIFNLLGFDKLSQCNLNAVNVDAFSALITEVTLNLLKYLRHCAWISPHRCGEDIVRRGLLTQTHPQRV